MNVVILALALVAPASGPTLSEYTSGASKVIDEITALYRDGPAAGWNFGGNATLSAAAAEWRRSARPGSRVEAWIVDFPPRPRENISMRVEVRLEGLALRSDDRLFAYETFDCDLKRRGSAWILSASRPARGQPTIERGKAHLAEVAAEIGLGQYRHETKDPLERVNVAIPATHHRPGVIIADFDGDGSPDILAPGLTPKLFLNDGHGRFRDATAGSGLDLIPPGEGAGGVAADLDGDGLPEIFLTYAFDACRLLHNDGGGKFHDITDASGLAGLSGPFTSAVFFDADRDGSLDLFVASYGDARVTGPAFSGKNGPGSRFFHNVEKNGRPFFVDETQAAGFADRGWAFAASACDYDDDGDDDLYVASDFGTHALYENVSTPGRPKFRQIARRAGVLDEGYGMGVAWGDYDGDGRFDLAVSDFSSPYRWMIRSPQLPMPPLPALIKAISRRIIVPMLLRRCRGDGLYRNRGDGTFERRSEEAGVADGGWAWGTEFADLDGDGFEDLLVVNGMWQAQDGGIDDEVAFWNLMAREGIAFHDGVWGSVDFESNGMASRTPKRLFHNRGDGTFQDRAWLEGFDTRSDARGLAIGDLDGDGAPDIVIATFHGPLLVYRNLWTTARRLNLTLEGGEPHNRQAIGAIARVRSGGRLQIREVRAGSSFLSESSLELSFGLAGADRADELEIRWPDGTIQHLRDLAAGRYRVKESSAPARR